MLYWEKIDGMQRAIDREKQLKNWHSDWKWNLIKEESPELKDLAEDWFTDDEIKEYKRSVLADSETPCLPAAAGRQEFGMTARERCRHKFGMTESKKADC